MSINRSHKGRRLEYAVRDAFIACGIEARRIPFSGSLGGDLCGDVHAWIDGANRLIECKSSKDGWPALYILLENNYGLALKRDRAEPLFVCRLSDYAKAVKQ